MTIPMKNNIKIFNPRFSVFAKFPIPRTENDFKLQTLLIYVHDRLRATIKSLEANQGKCIFDKETEDVIIKFDKELCNIIEEYVPTYDSIYSQREEIIGKINPTALQLKIISETIPFSTFNNRIVEECEQFFSPEKRWIPDLVAISLLNYWIADFSKRTFTYSFIYKLNLQEILDLYNKVALKNKSKDIELSKTIDEMYSFSEMLIIKISKMKYKTVCVKNKSNKKTRRKKWAIKQQN